MTLIKPLQFLLLSPLKSKKYSLANTHFAEQTAIMYNNYFQIEDSAAGFRFNKELEMHPKAHQTDTFDCILCPFASAKLTQSI